MLAPAVAPLIGGVIKPLAKAAIKGCIILSEKGKQAFAELKEVSEDLVAEARAELAEQQKIQETTEKSS